MKGTTWVVRHTKRVKVIAEPLGDLLANKVVVASTHGKLKLGLGKVSICLCNLTVGEARIPNKIILGQVQQPIGP